MKTPHPIFNPFSLILSADLLVGDGGGEPGGGGPGEVDCLVHQGEAEPDGGGVEHEAGHGHSETSDHIHQGVLSRECRVIITNTNV